MVLLSYGTTTRKLQTKKGADNVDGTSKNNKKYNEVEAFFVQLLCAAGVTKQ